MVDPPKDTSERIFIPKFYFLILKQSKKFSDSKINFWRPKDGAEIDFVINTGMETIPIEAKETLLKKLTLSWSLKNFIIKYQPKKVHLGNKTLDKEIRVQNTKIIALPYWKLLD